MEGSVSRRNGERHAFQDFAQGKNSGNGINHKGGTWRSPLVTLWFTRGRSFFLTARVMHRVRGVNLTSTALFSANLAESLSSPPSS